MSDLTPRRRSTPTVASVAVALVLASLSPGLPVAQPAAPQQQPLPVERIEFAPGHDIPSSVCGKCHEDIYEVWRTSVHAGSFVDPVFQAALAEAIADEGSEVARTCLACHSPGSMLMRAPVGVVAPEREGIGCRFCHAIRDVDLEAFPPFELETELVMMGRMNAAESPVHQIRASTLLGSPRYCAACHEYTTPAGATLLSTYSEFAGAGHPDYVACQDCHMPFVMGNLVDPSVTQADEFAFVDSHAILGGRNLAQVRRAVTLEIVSVQEASGSIEVLVAVANRGAGHWLPTGMPSKQIVLEVSTSWDSFERAERFVFGRRVLDDAGNRLMTVADMMTRGAAVASDTRLRPGQQREFSFSLPAPLDADTRLVVRLFYQSTEDAAAVDEDIHRIERDF
jgi:hypothetical protein